MPSDKSLPFDFRIECLCHAFNGNNFDSSQQIPLTGIMSVMHAKTFIHLSTSAHKILTKWHLFTEFGLDQFCMNQHQVSYFFLLSQLQGLKLYKH